MKLQFTAFPIAFLICLLAEKLPGQALIDMALYNVPFNSNTLEIRLRPTQNVPNLNFSAGVVTVRFPSALNGTLGVVSSQFGYTIQASGLNQGGYDYYALGFDGQNMETWTAGQEYVAAVLQFSNGPAVGGFQLITGDTWTNANNANFYAELNGLPRQGIFYTPTCTVSGNIEWHNETPSGVGVKDATVNLTVAATGSDLTDVNGDYGITVNAAGNFTITPVKNSNKTNGVTVADAIAIQQHLTLINEITNPYRLVAADVNKSNTISTLDAAIINQVLLGNPTATAQFKTSWRFVPQSYVMNMPPWGFPEKIDLTGVSGNQPNQDFYGIKTGDVVANYANPANFGGTPPPGLVWRVEDRPLRAGDQLTVLFSAEAFDDLAAWQFALHFDPEKLQFDSLETLPGLPLTADHFGFYEVEAGEIRSVWLQEKGVDLGAGTGAFRLRFSVKESGGWLSEALRLDDAVLAGEAYTSLLGVAPVQLAFFKTTQTLTAGYQSALLQNRPNPFNGTTAISFVLPENCEAQLRISDLSGRILAERTAQYPAGRNEEAFDLGSAAGILFYELTTPFGILTKKMVAMQK